MSLVYLGLGSNLGDRRANIQAALELLDEPPQTQLVAVSHLFETPALLPEGSLEPQPAYLNAACALSCTLKPLQLLERLRAIETHLGRPPERPKWSPRLIDLDILLWGAQSIDEPGLKVPHPEMHKRRFVLAPLAEIAPGATHPVFGKSIAQLLEQLSTTA